MKGKNKINFIDIHNFDKNSKNIEHMYIDNLDKKILNEILNDSRLSYRQIAKKLKISTGTVLNRIKQLQNNNIIKYYTTILDHEKLGYDLSVIIEIKVSKGKLIDIEKIISKHPNVCAVYDTTGLNDAFIIAKFKTKNQLNAFVKGLLEMEFVERTNTHLILNTIKEDFRLI